ncbi:hypothetical protein [Psychroserpens luteus]|uniref:Uncharacterized protein n=1 Tax=Psychroserpens luteus TaxID=1434066 RepID=A0ABW5ZUZ7_9FLAO|nr:hypothetical protein [Psychroserpens luteus]
MVFKLIKITIILFIFLSLFYVICIISVDFLTDINPNYIILEDGKKGYYMNTENLFFGVIIAFGATMLSFLLIFNKLKYLINK